MNKTKRIPTSPAPVIECGCSPPDTCTGGLNYCFTQYGVSFNILYVALVDKCPEDLLKSIL